MAPRIPTSSPDHPEYEKQESNLALANKASPSSFLGKIVYDVNVIVKALLDTNPDAKHNVGRILGEAFLWDELQKYAAAKSKAAWESMEADGIYKADDLEQGDHILCESPRFVLQAGVSKPRKSFDSNALANWFSKSKYKVPAIIVKEQIEKAKVEGKSVVTLKIIER